MCLLHEKRCPVGLAQMLSSCGKSIKIKWIPLWVFVSWFHPSMYSLNGISNVCLAMVHFYTGSHFQYFMYLSPWKLKSLAQKLGYIKLRNIYSPFPSHNTVNSRIIFTLVKIIAENKVEQCPEQLLTFHVIIMMLEISFFLSIISLILIKI